MNYYPLLLATFYILFTVLAWRRLSLAVLFVIAALPSYLIRFQIAGIPTTILEGMLTIVFIAAIFHRIQKIHATPLAPTRTYRTLISETFNYPLRQSLTLPLGLFLIAATISLFIAPDLREAAGIWKAYFFEPILFFLVLTDLLRNNNVILSVVERSEESLTAHMRVRSFASLRMTPRSIIFALSLTALLLSLYAIYQRVSGFGIPPPWDTELRVTSIFPYPNALGLFLAPLVPLFISRIIASFSHPEPREGSHANVRRQLVIGYWLLVISASITAIIFAKSTGALIGVVAGLFFMAFLHLSSRGAERPACRQAGAAISETCLPAGRLPRPIWGSHPRRAGAMTIVGGLILITILLSIPRTRNELLLRDWSGHVRRTQWSETIEMLKDTSTPQGLGRPILGAGLSGYKETLVPYHKATYLEIFEYPHDIVMNFWSETGLLGLLSFLWLITLFVMNTHKLLKPERTIFTDRQKSFALSKHHFMILGAAGSMTTLLVHGLVDVPYFKNDLALLFWIIYALGLNVIPVKMGIQST